MASLTDAAANALDKLRPAKPPKQDKAVKKKLERGRERLAQVAPRRKQAIEFARGNHYVSIDKTGLKLVEQSTVPRWAGGEKPDHRVRRSHDLIGPILKGKVSGATQRIPGYEVVPSTSDPEDYAATRLSKKILVAGYEEPWGLKQAFRKFVWNALVTEEAFIMPFWDATVGPFIDTEEGPIGMGEVRACVYSGLEVIWEPGVDFEDSRWFAIEHARPKDDVEAEEGFLGGEGSLNADADEHAMIAGREKPKGGNLVMVTEYFERPSVKHPKGRRLTYANGREIFAPEDYPLEDAKGRVVDAPCLYRAVYSIDGSSDRHRGLVQSMIEIMRAYDYGANKAAEYLQLVLVPQIMAPEGAIKGEIDDEPGGQVEIDKEVWEETGGEGIKWRDMPSMPNEFGEVQDRAQAALGFVANDNAIPSQVESGKGIEAFRQKDAVAWQDFLEDLARVHASVGRDILCIIQRRYTEDRLFKFRGSTGWETMADFRGAQIREQTDVRVSSASFEARSRAEVQQQIMQIAGPEGLFPGKFPAEVVLRALSTGDIDLLNEAYEADEARINFIIAQIRAGTFWDLPKRPVFPNEDVPRINPRTGEPLWIEEPEYDEETGAPIPGTGKAVQEKYVEGWMPRPFDNVPVWKLRLETFMKSDEWGHLPARDQMATMDVYRALIDLETRNAARAQELQTQRAEELGMQNAAAPQGGKQMPSQPSETGGGQEEGPVSSSE
ncbi:MAG TPA: hypothetical protein VF245_12710 [Solirubrobacterales bacterium]